MRLTCVSLIHVSMVAHAIPRGGLTHACVHMAGMAQYAISKSTSVPLHHARMLAVAWTCLGRMHATAEMVGVDTIVSTALGLAKSTIATQYTLYALLHKQARASRSACVM